MEIKKAAKQGNKQAATVLAKQLIQMRKQKTRTYVVQSQIRGANSQSKVMGAKLAETMGQTTKVMGQKNSKFKGLNQMLLRMDETGELQRLRNQRNQYFLNFGTCQEGSNWSSVGIEKLASIFIFLLICIILSFFCLIFEKLWK